MLITVGVLLDTMRQIETFLMQRHYDGFLKKGKIRGRSAARAKQLVGLCWNSRFLECMEPTFALFVIICFRNCILVFEIKLT